MYSSGFWPPPPVILYPWASRSAAIAAFCARVAAPPSRPPLRGAVPSSGSGEGPAGAAGLGGASTGSRATSPGSSGGPLLPNPPPPPLPPPSTIGGLLNGSPTIADGRAVIDSGPVGTTLSDSPDSGANQPGLGGVPVRGCFSGSQNLSSRLR